ncbi:MAG: cupin domain-containing protein [Magnetovibrio sp.]|nr:cupin domain-containing protein [Magnetovibrio sp.]
MRYVLSVCAILSLSTTAMAEDVQSDYTENTVTPLLSSPKSVIGETITYPGGTKANIVSAIVTIAPGKETGWHKHGVPLYAYMISGELTVDYGDKGVKTYTPGMAFMEAMDKMHNGMNKTDKPASVLAVYMGAEGFDNVIRPK